MYTWKHWIQIFHKMGKTKICHENLQQQVVKLWQWSNFQLIIWLNILIFKKKIHKYILLILFTCYFVILQITNLNIWVQKKKSLKKMRENVHCLTFSWEVVTLSIKWCNTESFNFCHKFSNFDNKYKMHIKLKISQQVEQG